MHFVFYINSLSSGGAERVMAKLANHFAGRGHTLDLVTQAPLNDDHYPLNPDINRISTASGTPSSTWLSAANSNIQRITRLRDILKRRQPDVVLAFMPTANVVAMLATIGLGVRVVISERVHPPFADLSKLRRWLQRLTYPHADRTVVLADESAAYFTTILGLKNLATIPNGVALPLPRGTPTIPPPAGAQQLVLFVGRMVEQKQPQLALAAFLSLRESFPDWQMVLIGDGPLGPEIDAEIVAAGASDHAQRIPRVGNIQDWYEAAEVFLFTSLYEGSPNALLEALACGCAVISTDCPTGPSDLIRDEINGRLIALEDLVTLRVVLQQLLQDGSMRQRFQHAGTEILNTHSDQQFFARWTKVLSYSTKP